MFKKIILATCMLTVLIGVPSLVFSSEIRELAVEGADDNRYGFDRVICVDGLKIFQTIAFGYGDGTGAAVSNIQLYEEKNGKVVPVRCNGDDAPKKVKPVPQPH